MNNNESEHLKTYLEAYLHSKGISLNKNFLCLNPEHQDKNTPSMSYWKGHDKVKCFGYCNRTFDIFDLVGWDYGTSDFLEQLQIVRGLYGGGRFTSANENKRKLATPEPPPDHSPLYPKFHAELHKTNYFTERGLSPEIQERFNLGYDPEAKAVIIPVTAHYYLTRKTEEKAYRNYGSVYPFNLEALNQEEPVFITESAIDALSIIELGFQAVALNGTPHRKPFLAFLENYSKTGSKTRPPLLIIAFDNDTPGQKAAQDFSRELKAISAHYVAPKFPNWYEDPNQALKLHKNDFRALLSDFIKLQPTKEAKPMEKQPTDKPQSQAANPANPEKEKEKTPARDARLSNYTNFFFTGEYKDTYIPTGFQELDNLLYDGLREGLYMLGAVSSMGKTTYALQLANQIAEQGYQVAYIALEQSREELLAKTYSMLTYADLDGHYPSTAREIRRYQLLPQHNREEIDKARERLEKYAGNLFIYEEIDGGIYSLVENHITETGTHPAVLFIDYLQIMPKPLDLYSGQDKQIVDANVSDLRRLARKYKFPIITLSILSRYFYSKPLTLQAYKESGGIEAGADYLLGIQPRGMTEWCNNNKDKHYDFSSLYKAAERELELVILKARNGVPGEVPLRYNAKYNYFKEMD